ELDPLNAEEDAKSALWQVNWLTLNLQRIEAELENKAFFPESADPDLTEAILREYRLSTEAVAMSLSRAEAAHRQALHEVSAAQERLGRAKELLPLIEKQYNQQLSLQKQGFVSDAALTDKQKELVDIRRE